MRCLEVTGAIPFLSPRFDELSVLREFHYTSVGISSMPIADEDIAIRRDQDSGRLIKGIRAIAGHPGLAERHQDFAFRTELENLVTLSVPVGILAVGAFSVAHPNIAFPVDVDSMRADKHSSAKALHQFSRLVELQNRSHVRPSAI